MNDTAVKTFLWAMALLAVLSAVALLLGRVVYGDG